MAKLICLVMNVKACVVFDDKETLVAEIKELKYQVSLHQQTIAELLERVRELEAWQHSQETWELEQNERGNL